MNAKHDPNGPCDGQVPPGYEPPRDRAIAHRTPGRVTVDLRGMAAPGPLVRTLELLAGLAPDEVLEAHFPRHPVHLFDHLEEGGWAWSARAEGEGHVIITIRHASEEEPR